MSRDRYSYVVASSSHAKPAHHRFLVALLAVTAIMLLVLTRTQHPALLNLRLQMLELMRPVMSAVSQPVSATRKLASSTGAALNAAEENRILQAENETLRHWQSVAQALKAENQSLRTLMAYQPVEHATYVTGRVIGQSPTNFGQFLTMNSGSEQGVRRMQPVVDAYGLVGRTLEVSRNSTRVMLLSDAGSRIPVVTSATRQRAILAGTGSDLLRLNFLDEGASINLGEAIVTTQEGDLIPGGIAIGNVFKRDATGYLVKLVRPLTRSEYLRVINQGAPAGTAVSAPTP